MEHKNDKDDGVKIDPALIELIVHQKPNKIRRPPNAFMLFAREHRKMVQKQNPTLTNKEVSTELGRMWKALSVHQKEKYYRESKMLSELHQESHPNYIYCPIEARKKKKELKKRKRDEEATEHTGHMTTSNDLIQDKERVYTASVPSSIGSPHSSAIREEYWNEAVKTERSPPKSEYLPNNLEYFSQQSSETRDGGGSMLEQEIQWYPQYPSQVESFNGSNGTSTILAEIGCTKYQRQAVSHPCGTGFNNRWFPQWAKDGGGTMPYFADHIPYPYASSSSFCNSASPWAQPTTNPLYGRTSSFSSQSPIYVPAVHPYWNHPSSTNTPSNQTEDYKPCSLQSPRYAYTPYYHPQEYGYHDRPASRLSSNPTHFREIGSYWNQPPNKTYEDYSEDELELQSYFKKTDRRDVKEESSGSPYL